MPKTNNKESKASWLLKTIVKWHNPFCFVGELLINNA
jgi:hypothetical protein